MFPGAANAETFAAATLILFRRLRTPQELWAIHIRTPRKYSIWKRQPGLCNKTFWHYMKIVACFSNNTMQISIIHFFLRPVQTLATLLRPTCCERLRTMLCVVATCWKLLDEVWNWSNFRANKCQHFYCFAVIEAWSNNVCTAHPTMLRRRTRTTYPHKYKRTRNQPLYSHLKTQHVVTCCERLHTSASIAQQEKTVLAQQCCVLLRAFARAFSLVSHLLLIYVSLSDWLRARLTR